MQAALNVAEAWESIRRNLCAQVGVERFRRWLDCLAPLTFEGGVLTIGTPNKFLLEWIDARYRDALAAAVAEVLGPSVRIELSIAGALFRQMRASQAAAEATPAAGAKGAANPPRHQNLETFIPGSINRSAYRAVLEILSDRETRYNPLVVLGPSGMGKSHLLQGLVHARRQAHRAGRIQYVSAFDFAASFRANLRQKKIARFRAFYRSLDLLAFDDFHALTGKRHLQEEFLHTFDALLNRGARVVIATAQHPGEIPDLVDRLRQRLVGGLLLRIHEPDFRTRLTIVRRESERMQKSLCKDVMELLARHVRWNVRELIGAVTRLTAYAALEGHTIGVAEAQKLLVDQLESGTRGDEAQRIIGAVCESYRLRLEDLAGASRRRRVVQARKLVFYFLRTGLDLSLREIGELVGGKKPPTVRAAVKDVEVAVRKASELGRRAEELGRALGLAPDGAKGL